MIIFWTLAAALAGLACLFIALPLLRGTAADAALSQGELNLQVFRRRLDELDSDLAAGVLVQGQYDAARKDLERELLADLNGDATLGAEGAATVGTTAPAPSLVRAPWLTLLLVITIPTAAVLGYLKLGDPKIIPAIESAAAGGGDQGHMAGPDGQQPALDSMVQGLAERLRQSPDNLEGWLMLGRTYFALQQPEKALEAMEHAYKLAPDDGGVMVSYAQALAASNGNNLQGRPAELIRTALERDPKNPNVRWLSGMLAFQEGRFAEAVATWQTVLDEVDPAGQEAVEIRQMIAEAQARGAAAGPVAGEAAPPSSTEGTSGAEKSAQDPEPAATDSGARIQVTVTLAADLTAQTSPTDTVFVFARAASGPPMPLAVNRIKVSDLPTTVTLDDSMAIVPSLRLSAFPQIIVGARISKSGQATPSAGDLEGQVGPLNASDTQSAAVTVDQVRP